MPQATIASPDGPVIVHCSVLPEIRKALLFGKADTPVDKSHMECIYPESMAEVHPGTTRTLGQGSYRWRSTVATNALSTHGKSNPSFVRAYVRKVLWKTCGVSSSSDVRPWQQNEDGSLDVFPMFLRDEKTGYGIPCPNWVVCLSEQVEWVPTYLERFHSMIPNDDSALSAKLRDQDGPLQTIKANWKAMELEPEAMAERRSKAKQNAWLDRKVLVRERYRDELSGLQGPEHDYLFNKGFVSPEVSDGEGGRIVDGPEYWARWVNNLIDAIDMASAQASKARPGHRDPPPRKHVVVKCEVPNLPACTGSKGTIRIAACAWSPRINPLLKDPPNIDRFLEKYPTSTPEDAYDETPPPTADDLENDGGTKEMGGLGAATEEVVKDGGGNMGEVVGEEGEQDGWGALDVGINRSHEGGMVGEGATSMGVGEAGDQNFPLDPVLGGESPHTMPAPTLPLPLSQRTPQLLMQILLPCRPA
ncbi:hypothetical protein FRC06_006619 [Ceratobasidium sp. 370]|nr:hypothetical protein FRC06_006619 [Ceratobasidium sp. 370]